MGTGISELSKEPCLTVEIANGEDELFPAWFNRAKGHTGMVNKQKRRARSTFEFLHEGLNKDKKAKNSRQESEKGQILGSVERHVNCYP